MSPQVRYGWVAVAAAGAAIVLGGVGYGFASGLSDGTSENVQMWLASAPKSGPCQGNVTAVAGTLTSVDGNRLTVRTANGGTRTVTTAPSTYLVEIAAGGVSDIHPGDRVLVHGSTSSGGPISAQDVHILPGGLPRPPAHRALPAQPGAGLGLRIGLAIGTVADRTANGFTVVGADGTRVPVTTSSATRVIDATRTSTTALRVGHQVEAVGTSGTNGAVNATEVEEIDAPVHIQVPVHAPDPPVLRLPAPKEPGAGQPPACLPAVRLPG